MGWAILYLTASAGRQGGGRGEARGKRPAERKMLQEIRLTSPFSRDKA